MAIYILSLLGFFAIFSTTISKNPVLPLFAQSLGANASLLGLLSALSPLAGILFSFPIGILADRFGKKRLLIIASIIFVSAPLLYLTVRNPWQLLPVRFFHGMATAILGPVAAALISDMYQKNRAQNLGWYSSATLVGRTLAPVLGGIVITLFSNYTSVYVVAFLLSLPVLVLSFFVSGKNKIDSSKLKVLKFHDFVSALRKFTRHRLIFLTSLVEMATYFIFGVYETYIPGHLTQIHIPVAQIGLLFSLQVLCMTLTKPFFGKLADSTDKRYQILAGLGILSLSLLLTPLFSNYFVLIFLSLFFGLGISVSTVATTAYIADLSSNEDLTGNLGALSSVMDIGQTFGPLIIGFVITAFSFKSGLILSAFFGLAITLLYIKAFSKTYSHLLPPVHPYLPLK